MKRALVCAAAAAGAEVYVQWLRFMPRGWCADGLEATLGRAVGKLVRGIYGAHQHWMGDARQLARRPGYPVSLQGLPGYGAFETSALLAEGALRDVFLAPARLSDAPIQRGMQYTENLTDALAQVNEALVDRLWANTRQNELVWFDDPHTDTAKALSDVVNGMLLDLGYFDPGAQRLRDGSALSSAGNLLTLVKSAFDLLRLPDGMNPKHHIEHLATSFCRVVDLEYGSLNGTCPIGCFGQDVAVSVSACTRALRQLLPDLEDCEAGTATSYEQINGFPARSEACIPSPESLQIQDIFGPVAHAAPLRFRIDPRMYVPIALEETHYVDGVPERVRQREALTYFFLWRAIIISYRTIYPACNRVLGPPDFNYQGAAPPRRSTAAQFVPGWHVYRRLNVVEPDGEVLSRPGVSTPLIFFLRSPREPCHLLLVIRGTQSNFEWILDFQFHSRPAMHANSTSVLQAGLATMGYSLLDAVRQIVVDELGACGCNADTKLTLTGHSLGGALSLFLSSALKDSLDTQGCADVRVRAVAFSTFRGMRNFNKEVIYRSISDRTDPLYSFPCFHGQFRGETEGNGRVGWPRCGNGHAVVSGVGRDNFPTPPGRIVMDATRQPTRPFETAQKYVGDVAATSSFRGFGANVATALSSYLVSNLSPSRTALELMLQNMESIYYVPSRAELIVGHASSISCGMSNACRADAASRFYWRCSKLAS